MKNINISLIVLIFSFLSQSCLEETETFENNFNVINTFETSTITTVLNEGFITESYSIIDCFEFNYPLYLNYNNELTIEVFDYNGLEELALAQLSNFHINSINFPFSINLGGVETTINNEIDFQEIISQCEIKSLNETIIDKIENCINISYPICLLYTSDAADD